MKSTIKYLNKRLSSLRWQLDNAATALDRTEIEIEIRRIKSDLSKIERTVARRPFDLQPA